MTKRQLAYKHIKARIAEGSLLPGQRVITGDIAKELSISALPVREALFSLESEGIVTFTPHVGAIVTVLSYEDVARVIEPLAVLEGYVTSRVRPIAHTIIDELRAANEEMERAAAATDWAGFSEANRLFHSTIYAACDNRRLISTMTDLSAQMDALLGGSIFVLIPERLRGSIAEHKQIVEMLVDPATNSTELELFARNHKLATQAYLETFHRAGARLAAGVTVGVLPG